MTDQRFMELCETRDKLLDQYRGLVDCAGCKNKMVRCSCEGAAVIYSDWQDLQLFMIHGEQHLASITVPTRIVAAHMAVVANCPHWDPTLWDKSQKEVI